MTRAGERARVVRSALRWVAMVAVPCALACSGETSDGGAGGAGASAGGAATAGTGAAGVTGGSGGVQAGSGGMAGVTAGTGGATGGSGGVLAGAGGGAAGGGAGATGGSGGVAGVVGGSGGAIGSSDAGVPDAGALDAGFDAGASVGGRSCAGSTYLICEDFEDAPVGGTPNGWTKHGDASMVTDAVAHDSARALELGPIPFWERRIYHDASALGSAHWGRIYFKVQLPVPDAFVHSTLVALSGVGPTRGQSEYRVVDTVKQAVDTPNVASRIQFLWNVQPQSSDEFGEGTSYDREFDDVWHCAEWRVDAADQSYAFYLDGTELISFAKGAGNYEGSDIPDSFQELKVGWNNYQQAPPGFTAWIDDVALDDERIGCL